MPRPTPSLHSPQAEKRRQILCGVVLGALLLAGLFTRGWFLTTQFDHPDEPIATGVNRWLDQSWDTNWRLASLPSLHNYDQYNFSAYHYAVHGWAKVTGPFFPQAWGTERNGVVLLRTFSVLCGALVVGWAFLIGRRLGNLATGLASALLVLVNPQLVADGHYARTEAMLSWLSLGVVWLALKEEWGWRWRLAVSAFVVGFMIAAKVTMGLMLVAPVWIGWRACRELAGVSRFWRFDLAVLAVVGLAALGFAAGVPGAIAHPEAFLHGVNFLMKQYGGFHEPHSEQGGGPVALALGKFYLFTIGGLGLGLGLAMAAAWWRRREWAGWALLVLPVLAYAGYFATKLVFFERNLSHVLPLGLVVVGTGVVWLAGLIGRDSAMARTGVGVLLLALVMAPGAAITAPLLTRAFSDHETRGYEKHQQEIKAKYPGIEWRPISMLFTEDLVRLKKSFAREQPPLLVQFAEFNDSYSRHYRAVLEREFVTEDAGVFTKALTDVPCSALNVYHGHRVVYKIITGRRQVPVTAP